MNEHSPEESAADAYARHAAALLDLTVKDEHWPGVVANLTLLRETAAPLLAFPLPDELEPAPVFEP